MTLITCICLFFIVPVLVGFGVTLKIKGG